MTIMFEQRKTGNPGTVKSLRLTRENLVFDVLEYDLRNPGMENVKDILTDGGDVVVLTAKTLLSRKIQNNCSAICLHE